MMMMMTMMMMMMMMMMMKMMMMIVMTMRMIKGVVYGSRKTRGRNEQIEKTNFHVERSFFLNGNI